MTLLTSATPSIWLAGTISDETWDAFGQRITIGDDAEITEVHLWMARTTNPTTTVTVAIYSRDNGNPVASLGNVSVDASGWSTSGAEKTFTFASPITISAGNYAIVVTQGSLSSCWVGLSTAPGTAPYALQTSDDMATWVTYGVPARNAWYKVYGNVTGSSYVDVTGIITGTSSLTGILEISGRLYPPIPTYWYSVGNFYYQLLVQSNGNFGSPPPIGVENTDYIILSSTYLPNFIRTNRRLVAVAKNNFYYEDI